MLSQFQIFEQNNLNWQYGQIKGIKSEGGNLTIGIYFSLNDLARGTNLKLVKNVVMTIFCVTKD